VLFTSPRWTLTVAWVSIPAIRSELTMELAIAMLNALMTLSSSTVKLTPKDGSPAKTTPTLELANTALAAWRWTSGKPTRLLKLSLPTLVLLRLPLDVKASNVVITLRLTLAPELLESVTSLDVIGLLTALETRPSSAKALTLRLTLPESSLLSLNSSLLMVLTTPM